MLPNCRSSFAPQMQPNLSRIDDKERQMKSADNLHDQDALTVSEAATLFERSTTWVYNQITRRELLTRHPTGVRPVLITAASAKELRDALVRRRGLAEHVPFLRLVVDNTK